MLVIEIDGFNSQAPEAGFAGAAHIVRLAVDAANVWILGVAYDAKLRGDYNFVALVLDGSADKFFVLLRAIHIGGVEEIDAKFKRAVNRRD
jgi:hypothetical protein